MNYKNVRKIINGILFEWNPRVTDDHSAGKLAKAQKGSEYDLPLAADDRTSIDSIVSKPPVEDSDYVPMSATDLGAAVRALSELLTGEQIATAYTEIKQAIENAGLAQPTPDSMKESAYDDYDSFELPDDSDMPEEFRTGYSIEEPEDEPEEELPAFKASKSSGEASLQDILDSGILPDDVQSISAVKAFITRTQKKQSLNMVFGVDNVKKAQGFAADIWIRALQHTGGISADHAAGFKQNIEGTKESPGFRSFWQFGFFEPAVKPIVNARNKKVKEDITNLGAPKELENMMFSQTIGLSPVNGKKIRMKLNNLFPDKDMKEIDSLVIKYAGYVKSNYKEYQQGYFEDVDLLDAVKDIWSKKSVDFKVDVTEKAMDDAADFDKKSRRAGLR